MEEDVAILELTLDGIIVYPGVRPGYCGARAAALVTILLDTSWIFWW